MHGTLDAAVKAIPDSVMYAALRDIKACATRGERAPSNQALTDKFGYSGPTIIRQLVNCGWIITEVYRANYRVIEICFGENTGLRTAEEPHGAWPYKRCYAGDGVAR